MEMDVFCTYVRFSDQKTSLVVRVVGRRGRSVMDGSVYTWVNRNGVYLSANVSPLVASYVIGARCVL